MEDTNPVPNVQAPNPLPEDATHQALRAGKPQLLTISLFILLLSSLSLSVFLLYQNLQLQKKIQTMIPQPTETFPPKLVDPTANWKTYNNSEFGFYFRYPKNFGNQGIISGPFTGKSDFLQSFSDPLTIRDNTDAPFDGFSLYVVTDMKTGSFDKYLQNELVVMNENEFARMRGAKRQEFSAGTALVTDSQAYYYIPTPNRQKLIVFAYLQANPSFKLTFNQILSTFEFLDEPKKCLTTTDPCEPTGCDYNPQKCQSNKIVCGGIAGIICSAGYTCQYDGNYPDASGTCVTEPSLRQP